MEEALKCGTLMPNLRPSDPSQTTNHWTLPVQARPIICKFGAQTEDGGKSSDGRKNTSSIPTTRRLLPSPMMLKDKELLSQTEPMDLTKDSESFMLTKLVRVLPRDMIEAGDSMSTEHSTSDLDSQ
jgi:hypothetical protein